MTLAEASRHSWPNQSDLGREIFLEAQESLYQYCKPVELYNIIQRRALAQPLFLQRCLSYKILAAQQRRIKMSVATIDPANTQKPFETFSVFAQVTNSLPDYEKDGFIIDHAVRIIACNEELHFLLPELRKLSAHSQRENSFILFVITGDYSKGCPNSLDKYAGRVFWGMLSLKTVCDGWMQRLRNMNGGIDFKDARVDIMYEVKMGFGTVQHENHPDGRRVKLRRFSNDANPLPPLRVRIGGEEIGRKALSELHNGVKRKPGRVVFHYLYYFNRYRKLEATENFSCPFCLVRCSSFKGLRCHLGASHDRFQFEFLATEEIQAVLVKCNEFFVSQGIDKELDSLHDPRLKSFSYCSRKKRLKPSNGHKAPEPRPVAPNGHAPVSNGTTPRKGPEHHLPGKTKDPTSTVGAPTQSNGQLPRVDRVEPPKPESQHIRRPDESLGKQVEDARSVASTSEQEPPGGDRDVPLPGRQHSLPLPKKQRVEGSILGSVHRRTLTDDKQLKIPGSVIRAGAASRDGSALLPPKISAPRPERNRKVSSERAEARNRALLQKRLFFHAHTGQPMGAEQLLNEEDSEDELDDAIASWEDRRMLDDFVDVTRDEKDVMHRWNDFVRRQRVIADGHCPWACEAFAKLHAEDFNKSPSLRRCFMLMLIKFWNNQLIDGRVMNECLTVVDAWRSSVRPAA